MKKKRKKNITISMDIEVNKKVSNIAPNLKEGKESRSVFFEKSARQRIKKIERDK